MPYTKCSYKHVIFKGAYNMLIYRNINFSIKHLNNNRKIISLLYDYNLYLAFFIVDDSVDLTCAMWVICH